MNTRRIHCYCYWIAIFIIASGCETLNVASDVAKLLDGGQALTPDTIVAGLKEALTIGTRNTVAETGKEGGYANVPGRRIALPHELERFGTMLRNVGLGRQVELFEAKMNAAAEDAAHGAVPIFVDAIRSMSFADANAILRGGETAATDYFRETTSLALRERYKPVVHKHLTSVGAVAKYNELLARYLAIPFAPKPTLDLDDYVVDQALDGLFDVLAREERAIRAEPTARTTALLRRVFAEQ